MNIHSRSMYCNSVSLYYTINNALCITVFGYKIGVWFWTTLPHSAVRSSPGFSLALFPVMYILPVLSLLVSNVGLASAQYTVYQPQQQVIFGGNANNSVQSLTMASAAYDPTLLQAPTPPDPPVPTNQFIQLYSGGMDDLSMPLSGAFFGFSIEMSIATRVRRCLLVLDLLSIDFGLFLEWEKIVPCFKSLSSI